MSEDKTQAATETVSESPAKETTQSGSNEQYIAESKKYRKRAQDAEARLSELEKKFNKQEELKLKEKEDFKTLYEQASSKIENLSSVAEKWNKYEDTKRASLLESHPEDDRESLKDLPLDTLEYVTNKINNNKNNAPETVGVARKTAPVKPVDWNNKNEMKANWGEVVNSYSKQHKQSNKG